MLEVEEHCVEDVDGPSAYFEPSPFGCSEPRGASPPWLVEWWRSWDEYQRLRAGLVFFAAVAVVGEEIVDA